MLNINKLMKDSDLRVYNNNGKNYVCINGHALYRQELWPNTECVTEPPEAIATFLNENHFIEAVRFPHTFSINKQAISLYTGESMDGGIIVKIFDANYTRPFIKRTSVCFGGSNEHKPLYVLDADTIDAIVMPWNVNWYHPVYGFLKRSVEDWFTKGDDGLNEILNALPEGLEPDIDDIPMF